MIRVFCDFDGTMTIEDVGNRLFRTYSGQESEAIVEDYHAGRINARECLRRECAASGIMSPGTIRSFADPFPLDPYAVEFVRFCETKGIPFTILSDGLDLYVEPILAKARLGGVPWFANHGSFVQTEKGSVLVPSFPYRDEHCDLCGNCKRNHMVTQSGDDDVLVYIGDGISDRCPVRYADVVFAKRDLIKYCQEQNISYFEFRHLGDVRDRLEQILSQGKVRQRREAAMARRDVFIAE
jgi:2,3-diketo-5-methylthio-1-phosphopentane phosphatase